ncbi:23S rRNA (uracil(1939)-C(5))-methyltransferase RlmD [Ignavibacteria bacterium CHB1]|jgi:23S rRNA (uracil1939-C5)-methyltransferase|nr:MAG: 23S rRNA (uracil(1939)-C(5))-methyltransferase RlmD [Chlorobiota bacterium]KXK06407.1 MAG: SAM-dependent methyltransferase [Chlorobi bacterium OLB4]MBV6399081.1 23S rRNA (uracil-C(5))-methyltransferase RlmCD [Ignavibacteria bacterium]MCC6885299.1 23S rRNA (uracil(1939)-C(5))-methyltransferase RlmD [Ignavibacteriales bacterium]MCE7953298.1 23S rRNA (uracil(1939)-C(5))-methyltransferase RlmD [Chlorobi bacterium CHB7]MDL1887284.1 23S rRNA (uracil(1939)-C(5))-methyltransferase RlmD [Ignavi
MKKGDELELTIETLSTEGKGLARTADGFVVFVENSLPQDYLIARVSKKKFSYAEAKLINLISPSPDRVSPECSYFGVCGGCKIQNYAYSKQLDFKAQAVSDAFRKIGNFNIPEIPDVIGSEYIYHFRNKMEFSFSNDKWFTNPDERGTDSFALGLHVPNFHSKIVDINQCLLQSELSNRILNFTRDFFKQRNISIYSTATHTGMLRFLVIRQSTNTNDLMVNLITLSHDRTLMNQYSSELTGEIPQITTLINSTTKSKAQVAFAEEQYILSGGGFITEKLFDSSGKVFEFRISPNSFFQTNSRQTNTLYTIAKDFGEFSKHDRVLDLYCGAGSISIFIADAVERVLGVEIVEDAIKNANDNKKINRIFNVDFICSDIKKFIAGNDINEFNKIIIDPPRSGIHPDIATALSDSRMEKIVYVSCNPSTQARDLKIICSKGNYKIEKIQPVDMFPHTYHIENVISLKAI